MLKKHYFPSVSLTTSGQLPNFVCTLMLAGLLVLAGFILSVGGRLPSTAFAAPKPLVSTIQVTNCAATSDASGGAIGTLNYALNHYNSGDTIQFACSGGTSGVYTITVPSTINLNNTLTLDGNGYKVTLDGGGTSEVFKVNSGANFTLNALTIADANAPANNCFGNNGTCGGAIFNSGALTVTNSTFFSNTAYSDGGAIFNNSGTIANISNSTFISNSTSFDGGAVFNYSGIISNIVNSTFISNTSPSTGGAIDNSGATIARISNSSFVNSFSSDGGAIYNDGTIISITNSSFLSNTASNSGGALYNYGGTFGNIVNSTFSNAASNGGGALFNYGTMSNIANSTFFSNTASFAGGVIYNLSGAVTATNTIFYKGAGNDNCANSPINDGGGNLADDSSCAFGNSSSRNSVSNINLGTIGYYNGGTTQTIPLLAGSAALFAGVSANCPVTDQNNQTRPKPLGTACDSGAFESGLQLSDTISAGSNPNPALAGQSVILTATVTGNGVFTPTGSVKFTNTTTNTPLGSANFNNNGIAVLTTTFATVGNFNIAAGYSSNLTFTSAITNFTQIVNSAPTTTTLTSNPNPSVFGQPVTLTAAVSSTAATGNVTFTIGTGNVVATLSNGGTATYVTSTLPVGSTIVTATYSGDSNYVGSTSNIVTQVVNPQTQPTNPPTIAIFAGNGQSTTISTTFPVALQAIVRDGNTGNPLPNSTVVFQAPSAGASGTFSPTNSTTFTATTDASGIATASAFVANGTVGSYQVTAFTSGATSPATFNLVNNPIGTASGYTYYLPFLANTANNFTTYLVFQNTANVSSTVAINFFDNSGSIVSAASGTCASVAALGECIVPNPFASGKQGQGIIVSQQPLNVIVSEATPFGGSAYAVSAGASNNLIAPVAIKGGLVDFTTQLSIFNGGNSSVAGTVQFFDQNGNHVTAADKSFNLAAHSTTIYDQSQDNTLSNFYGWAKITSPAGSQLVAQTLEQRPSVKFVAIVNAQFNPQTTLYAPAIFNTAFGSFITGANLVNPNSQPVTVSITYYKNDGTASNTSPFTIGPNGVIGIFQGATSGNGLPSGGLPSGWYGAATVKVIGGSGIVMFVNEQGGLTATGSDQSGTYGAAVSGSSTVGLPVMANGAFGGYITGATIENITSSPVTATVQYYDLNGNAVGTAKTVTIGGNASAALYQGGSDQALPNGFYGTAQITVTGGPSSSLLVTTNAQSNAFFYSYTEPNF